MVNEEKRLEALEQINELVLQWAEIILRNSRDALTKQYEAGANKLMASGTLVTLREQVARLSADEDTVAERILDDLSSRTRSRLRTEWAPSRVKDVTVRLDINPA